MELGQIVAAVAAIYLASLSKNLRSLFVALLHAAAVSIKSPEKCAANGVFKLACFVVELRGFCVVARADQDIDLVLGEIQHALARVAFIKQDAAFG